MSPTTQFHDHHHHAKREAAPCNGNMAVCPPPLKVSKDSHMIKKPSSSPLAVGSTTKPQQQRHPVIIYTHSPKVIKAHPKDFMALVQKLTGLSRNEGEQQKQQNGPTSYQQQPPLPKVENSGGWSSSAVAADEDSKRFNVGSNDDNDSSSVITDENCDGGGGNSCFAPQFFDPPPAPFLPNLQVFTPNTTEFLFVNQPSYRFADSFFYPPHIRSSVSSSALDGMNEFHAY